MMFDQSPKQNEPAAVTFSRVSVIRSGNVILDSASAQVPEAGATFIIGPNGAGKTTLIKTLLNLIPFQGGVFFTQKGSRPRIGYVPQTVKIDGGLPLTVMEFLALNRQRLPLWFGVRRRYRREILALLEMVGIKDRAKRRLGDLSGGEFRRALLALALGRKPELLVMDEPTSGIDFQGESSFHNLMSDLRKHMGFTQLMICHNLRSVRDHATHVVCLNRKVVAEGPPEAVLTPGILTRTFLGQEMEIAPALRRPTSEMKHA